MTNRHAGTIVTLLGLAALLVSGVASAQSRALAVAPGDLAPEMRGQLPGGESIALDFSGGSVTLVNFWAIWCEPCKEEMPRLEQLYRDRAGDGLEIVGVLRNDDSDDETLKSFIEEMGISYTIVRPRGRYAAKWGGTSVLPTSFLLDGEGYVRRRYVGATPQQIDALIFDLEAALDGRPLGPYIVAEEPNAVSAPPLTD